MATITELITEIRTLRKELNKKVLQAAQDSIVASTEENFKRGGYTNDGGFDKWDNTHGYDKQKKKYGDVQYLLGANKHYRTGRLKKLSSKISGDTLIIGSKAKYAEAFQEGGTYYDGKEYNRGGVRLATGAPRFPYQTQEARPFLGWGKQNEQDMQQAIDKIFSEAFKG